MLRMLLWTAGRASSDVGCRDSYGLRRTIIHGAFYRFKLIRFRHQEGLHQIARRAIRYVSEQL